MLETKTHNRCEGDRIVLCTPKQFSFDRTHFLELKHELLCGTRYRGANQYKKCSCLDKQMCSNTFKISSSERTSMHATRTLSHSTTYSKYSAVYSKHMMLEKRRTTNVVEQHLPGSHTNGVCIRQHLKKCQTRVC